MRRTIAVAAALLLSAVLPGSRAEAALGDAIDNAEVRVNGHGSRVGAEQLEPDISATFAVWWDLRGNSSAGAGNSIWSKNLSTRGEAPVTTLTTTAAVPRISGKRVVWADRRPGSTNDDIFARKLPNGDIVRVTKNAATQLNPVIDGTTVVWEDKRNGDIDIYMKVLGKRREKPVVVAPGDQTLPSVSGSTIVWRDGRRGLTAADVWARIGNGAPFEVARSSGAARSISSMQVAVSGSRIVWNETDPDKCGFDCVGKILKTCTLPVCANETVLDALASSDPEGSEISEVDISGTSAIWTKRIGQVTHAYTADVSTCDDLTCDPPAQVDTSADGEVRGGSRVDGTRYAWTQWEEKEGSDTFWRDFTNGIGPLRANSIGQGPFASAINPAADDDLVTYVTQSRTFGGEGGGAIWATDLSPRRHFAVAPDLATGFSSPAIAGTRVAWSDLSGCGLACSEDTDDTYERDPLDTGSKVQLSSPAETGGPPDVDGASTAWRCKDGGGDPTALCVEDGTLSSVDVSAFLLDPSSVIGDRVRISGDNVAWYEYWDGGGPNAQLHVYDMSLATDTVVADGLDKVGEFPDFDIAGTNVVWAGLSSDPSESKIWRNTVTGTPLDATVFQEPQANHSLTSVTMDGTRVAWMDCPSGFQACDVVTRDLGEPDAHVVSNLSAASATAPSVDGDRIYWQDDRNDPFGPNNVGSSDVFMEDISGDTVPPPDATPPAAPTGFTAVAGVGDVDLAWTNPADADFLEVRILRRAGTTPPTSIDDRKATMVYQGDGIAFTDEDVVDGKSYAYRIFAIDTEGNASTLKVVKTVTA